MQRKGLRRGFKKGDKAAGGAMAGGVLGLGEDEIGEDEVQRLPPPS